MLDNEPDRVDAQSGSDRQETAGAQPVNQQSDQQDQPVVAVRTRRRSSRSAQPPVAADQGGPDAAAVAAEPGSEPVAETKPTRRRRRTIAVEESSDPAAAAPSEAAVTVAPTAPVASSAPTAEAARAGQAEAEPAVAPAAEPTRSRRRAAVATLLFMAPTAQEVAEANAAAARERAGQQAAPDEAAEPVTRSRKRRSRRQTEPDQADLIDLIDQEPAADAAEEPGDADAEAGEDDDYEEIGGRRRRRRGRRGRGRGKGGFGDDLDDETSQEAGDVEADAGPAADEDPAVDDDPEDGGLTRRRRRRRRKGAADTDTTIENVNVVVRIREPRVRDEVQSVSGSTRLEAKRQRRRDGREQRRTRPPILSESEFLARREAVDRVMVVRQHNDRTQIAVLEDGILVEHYVARASAATMVGNVYLGRVQNVLPSMEAAFVDLGRGRNAVLYAGEVNWDASGLEGRTRTIEQALKSGDSVLVQVTKDPIGTKGARLTSHAALSGRHLVFVPNGNASGISRKLPDIERKRLRDILKNLVPDGAGVIVRTAAEGASEDELARDVKRLQSQWDDIRHKAASSSAPALLYGEPDLVIRVVRDLFNEDFKELVLQGTDAYETVESYLSHVSPDLVARMHRYPGTGDVFAAMRIDEQIIKGLDRRVFLPSGGHLVIDRTEAMTVIDVNTGKYTGVGGNLEETVTRNNLEAAEEIVRQLRLRDIGGIIVIDFIDMVLESNRDLVLRRLTECLGRDRTKHQVTEITSLGLVQMTRKRVGQGLVEAFSETCEVCKGRGLIFHTEPVGDRRNGERSGAAKVAAAASDPAGGGDTADGGDAPARSGRKRGRKAAAEVVAPPVAPPAAADGDEGEATRGARSPAAAQEGDGGVAGDGGAEVDGVDDTDEDGAAAGGRRRDRRGGSRRRTRP
jgi:ribonuclease E